MNRKRQVSIRESFFETFNSLIRVGGTIAQASEASKSGEGKSFGSLSSHCPIIDICTEAFGMIWSVATTMVGTLSLRLKKLIGFFRKPFSNQSARLQILSMGPKFINRSMNTEDSIVLHFSCKGSERGSQPAKENLRHDNGYGLIHRVED